MSEVYKNLFQLSTQVKLLGKYETKNNKCNFTLIDTSISLKKHFKIEAVSIENTTFNQLLKNEKLKKLHELLLKIEGLIAERKPLLRIQLEFEQEKWHYMLIDYLPDNFFVCSLYDITREYRYLEEFENFFKLIPDLFCVLDDKAVFVKVNPMWEKIMGYKEKDLVGKTFFELTHPDEYEETYVNWESFKNQTALNSFTIRYKSKDKQYRYLDWKIYRYQNKYYAGARDVTRTVEKNTRLEKLAEFSNDLFLTVGSRPDVKTIIENLLWLSNSKFCFVNIYNQQSGSYITRYVVGDKRGLNKLEKIWGESLQGKEWKYKTSELEINTETLLPFKIFKSFDELPEALAPKRVKANLMKNFPIGDITVYKINFKDRTIGDLVFMTKKGEEFSYSKDLDIYIQQIGLLFRRLKVETALKVSENTLRQIIDLVPHFIFAKDYNGKFILANKSIADSYGTTTEEIIGKTDADFNPEIEQVERFLQDDRNVIETGKEKTIMIEDIWTSSGSKSVLQTIKIPFINHKTNETCVLGVSTNITERVNAENKLRTSEARYRNLVDSAADAILLGNLEGDIIGANKQIESMSLYTREELYKMKIDALIVEQSLKNTPLRYDLVLKNKSVRRERLIRRKDGIVIPIEMNTRLMPDGTIQTIIRDIEETKRIQKELIAAKEKAEENDRLKSAFLSNMSHEIRTPMNAIVGFSSLLADSDLEDAKRKYYFEIVESNCNNLLRIIDDLLDISKIESGQLEIINAPCFVNKTMIRVHDIAYDIAAKSISNIDIILKMPEENINVFTDETRLMQILLNLTTNALQFTIEGEIIIGLDVNKDNLMFYVEDTGCGISQEMMPHIFDRFYRLERIKDSRHGGTGLGLTICKSLVEMMGGKIWIESEVDVGTKVFFTLPNFDCGSTLEANNVLERSLDFSKYSVLVVEDDKNSMEFWLQILKKIGFKSIKCVVDGEEAVKMALKKDFDIILMDIQIPGINGIEAVKIIKKEKPYSKIIAQTAFTMQNNKESCITAGFDDYIMKPIIVKDLINILETNLKL